MSKGIGMDLKDVPSLIGAITGPLGLVISLLVYFRDRAKVLVTLSFDMQGFGGLPAVPEGYFVVRIHNVGRRPIYLSTAHITVPRWARKRLGATHLLLGSGLQGVTIAEGGAPQVVPTRQADLTRCAEIWPYVRAAVIDAAGRTYYSDWPTRKPQWAGDYASRFRVFTNKVRNRLRRLRP
jgi:hypothetical protein